MMKHFGSIKSNMSASTAMIGAGGAVSLLPARNSPSHLRRKDSFTRKPIDWSNDTIVVNGRPFTIIFPTEK